MKATITLAALVVLAWAWLLAGAGVGMEQMDMGGGHIMLMRPEWAGGHVALVFLMWVTMTWRERLAGVTGAALIAWGDVSLALAAWR